MDEALVKLRLLYLECRSKGIMVNPHVAYIAIQSAGDYSTIRNGYLLDLENTIVSVLEGWETWTIGKGIIKQAMATAFLDSFETGWIETGGDPYEPEADDSEWLATRIDQELANIDSMFVDIKAMMNDTEEPLTSDEIAQYAQARAQGYTVTLDSIYGQGKLRGKKSVMLTLDGPDGQKSCATCQRYKQQRHRARWWISHGLVPEPGNENYECGCWQCQHKLSDDKGVQWAGVQG